MIQTMHGENSVTGIARSVIDYLNKNNSGVYEIEGYSENAQIESAGLYASKNSATIIQIGPSRWRRIFPKKVVKIGFHAEPYCGSKQYHSFDISKISQEKLKELVDLPLEKLLKEAALSFR